MGCNCTKAPPLRKLATTAASAAVRFVGAVLTGDATKVSPATEAQRLAICEQCDRCMEHADKPEYLRCLECGCWLNGKHLAKARLTTEACPLGKWKATR